MLGVFAFFTFVCWEMVSMDKISHKLSSPGSSLSAMLVPQVESCCKILETLCREGKEVFLIHVGPLAGVTIKLTRQVSSRKAYRFI